MGMGSFNRDQIARLAWHDYDSATTASTCTICLDGYCIGRHDDWRRTRRNHELLFTVLLRTSSLFLWLGASFARLKR